MFKVNELFAGIGAFRKALQRQGIPHEIVGISEIDKFAIKSYEAMYGATRNYGDISKVDKLDYADLWTYGFPCQDISAIGKQVGIVKNKTRSGLLYEVQRLLSVSKEYNELPKFLILENVKNLVGINFIGKFEEWIKWLDNIGYSSYWKVINAKDCGIPQNRERLIAISIRKDIDRGFTFPGLVLLKSFMCDFLEENAEDKYFCSDAFVKFAEEKTVKMSAIGNGFKFKPRERERGLIAHTITTKAGSRIDDNFIKERMCDGKFRIRKLTPLECWRLMGFDDEDFRKAEAVNSNTQLYKQAGNSIVVNVLEGILANLQRQYIADN